MASRSELATLGIHQKKSRRDVLQTDLCTHEGVDRAAGCFECPRDIHAFRLLHEAAAVQEQEQEDCNSRLSQAVAVRLIMAEFRAIKAGMTKAILNRLTE